jgi:hypothetical protein
MRRHSEGQNAKASGRPVNHRQYLSGVYTPACSCREWRRSGRRCRWFGSGYTVWSRGSERPSLLCASPCLCSAGSCLCGADMLLDSRRPGLGWISGHLVSTPHPSLRLTSAKPLAGAAVAEDFATGSGQLSGRVARGSTFRKAGCGTAFRLFFSYRARLPTRAIISSRPLHAAALRYGRCC